MTTPAARADGAPGAAPVLDPAVLDLLPDPVLVADESGRVVAVNGLAARLLGRPVSEVVGRPAAEACPLRDDTQSDWWACVRPFDGDPRLVTRIPEADLWLTTATGATRPVTVTAARALAADGGVASLVLSLRRAERRQRLDAARSELVSTVSHELRSPLTSVKGFTKTLLAKWDRFSDDQKRQMLATVNEDADRVTRLLGELLDVSRIDAGKLRLRRQMLDVAAVIDRVVARWGTARDGRPVLAEPDPDLPRLYADPDKVEQIVTNLVENGLKYGAGTVRVRSRTTADLVEFVVTDEGDGIPTGSLPHVFAKFYALAGERPSGTGLGLYITKGIVEAHGGRIWAGNPPGGGAAFHFTLPRGGLELAGIPHDARPAPPGTRAAPVPAASPDPGPAPSPQEAP